MRPSESGGVAAWANWYPAVGSGTARRGSTTEACPTALGGPDVRSVWASQVAAGLAPTRLWWWRPAQSPAPSVSPGQVEETGCQLYLGGENRLGLPHSRTSRWIQPKLSAMAVPLGVATAKRGGPGPEWTSRSPARASVVPGNRSPKPGSPPGPGAGLGPEAWLWTIRVGHHPGAARP